MATGSDVRDILDLDEASPAGVSPAGMSRRDVLFGADKPKRKPAPKPLVKKPEGLSREVWGLLYSDSRDPPPIVPTDSASAGYKQAKIKLGVQRVRPWRWTPFANPARKDSLVLHHWRRVADEGKEYPFARFDKSVDVPVYSDAEYAQHLHEENWSKPETDHLFDLARRFDLRFVVMQDRYDVARFVSRSVEDLKERYYAVSAALQRARSTTPAEEKPYVYDADHERRRKEQLRRLWDRTPEEIEEEQTLIADMRKIEQRKKDREKRAGDLQKLLSKAADVTASGSGAASRASASSVDGGGANKASLGGNAGDSGAGGSARGPDGKKLNPLKKKNQHSSSSLNKSRSTSDVLPAKDPADSAGIRFSDFKTSGVTLRSQRLKLPSNVGQKKTKAIESMLTELGVDVNPIPTEEIGDHFNDLRSDMVLLYELKTAVANCEYELQTLRLRKEAAAGSAAGEGSLAESAVKTEDAEEAGEADGEAGGTSGRTLGGAAGSANGVVKQTKKISEVIDVQRKRKAALEQKNVLNKLKNRSL